MTKYKVIKIIGKGQKFINITNQGIGLVSLNSLEQSSAQNKQILFNDQVIPSNEPNLSLYNLKLIYPKHFNDIEFNHGIDIVITRFNNLRKQNVITYAHMLRLNSENLIIDYSNMFKKEKQVKYLNQWSK